jgi:hypothetical protein
MSMFKFHSLLTPDLTGWKMSGDGGFRAIERGAIESYGGSGLLWYADQIYENFVLNLEWRTTHGNDNSGVFIRSPPLVDGPQAAIERGYEIQIDDRGYDPETDKCKSPLHITGSIYKLAPAKIVTSRGAAIWNEFEITARGELIQVVLNGEEVCRLDKASREPRGHIALQAHHEGSRVQFRNLRIRRLED